MSLPYNNKLRWSTLVDFNSLLEKNISKEYSSEEE